MVDGYTILDLVGVVGHRLVSSQFPPIALFDDVADEDEFAALYEFQALTNPRLLNEAGNLNLLPHDQIPFGIVGCSYAVGPFTHINPQGTRFGTADFGVLYAADKIETAICEVRYHQQLYWSKVVGLKDDVMTFRGLKCNFDSPSTLNACDKELDDPIYHPANYSQSQALGREIKRENCSAVQYKSVRKPGGICWGLFTPRYIKEVVQTAHYQMIWQGRITEVQRVAEL